MPTLAETSKTYADLKAKRVELQAERTRVQAELAALRTSAAPYDEAAGRARVDVILGRAIPQAAPPYDEKLRAVEIRLNDLASAIDVVDRDIVAERGRASAKIRDAIAPAYQRLEAAFAAALLEAHRIDAAKQTMIDDMISEDVLIGNLRGDFPTVLDNPRDCYGVLAQYLRAAAKAGLIADKDFPAGLRQ